MSQRRWMERLSHWDGGKRLNILQGVVLGLIRELEVGVANNKQATPSSYLEPHDAPRFSIQGRSLA